MSPRVDRNISARVFVKVQVSQICSKKGGRRLPNWIHSSYGSTFIYNPLNLHIETRAAGTGSSHRSVFPDCLSDACRLWTPQPELLKLSSLPALTSSSAATDTSEENVAGRLESLGACSSGSSRRLTQKRCRVHRKDIMPELQRRSLEVSASFDSSVPRLWGFPSCEGQIVQKPGNT